MIRSASAFLVCMILVLAGELSALSADEILVVSNKKVAGSKEVAERYLDARGIPAEHHLEIETSDKEEISRDEFDQQIKAPIAEWLAEHEGMLAIVPVWGVPLKVKESGKYKDAKENFPAAFQHDHASVDSELITVLHEGVTPMGVAENPFFNKEELPKAEDKLFIVCRLDGPSKEIALGLIDKALLAETLGMSGQSFLDTRGITKNDGYGERDKIMREIAETWKEAAIDFEHDDTGPVIDISKRENLLHYYGWYAGKPKFERDVVFRTGSVAIHLHSFAAATARDTNRNWVAPLLNWGATATYGTAYEPYTVGFPYENIFWDRLCSGHSFGEAAMASNRLLSWQSVFFGDPLYTPYRENAAEELKQERAAVLEILTDVDDEQRTFDALSDPAKQRVKHSASLLSERVEAIEEIRRKDIGAAFKIFREIAEYTEACEYEAWILEISEPFERLFEEAFDEIEKIVKRDENRTKRLEKAAIEWKGLAIHEKVMELIEELRPEHQEEYEDLLEKAERDYERENWFDAWMQASEAMSWKYAESHEEAQSIHDEISQVSARLGDVVEEAEGELRKLIKDAERSIKREKYEDVVDELWNVDWFPECELRTQALKLLADAEAALANAED